MASAPDTRSFTRRLSEDVRALADAPRELWLVFAVKFFERRLERPSPAAA